ncbi:MAG: penicillin-binding protein 1C, partial [Desulfovibrio sp.]|nr:penicillin-binding protein 1C [Desulfovibrio sp.]
AYFNLAPYGGNVEGLGAAAWVYFHKPPAELTRLESTALMLVPQNPAVRQPSSANRRFFDASARLLKEWYGTTETAPLRVYGTRDLPFACPHLSGELLLARHLPDMVATPIDPAQQELLERALKRFARRNGPRGLANAAALLVHWPTMEVRALAGSADFASEAISGQIDGTLARRSPGSTLKPFIYALALEQGLIHPMTLLKDLPRSFAGYDPENFDYQFRGPLPAGEALRLSRNVPALSLAARLKNPDLYDFLVRCHVAFAFSKEHFGLSLVLGGAEVTMRELAACYAMLANKGVWQPLKLWNAPAGEALREQRLSPEASFVVLRMLESPASEAMLRTKGQGRLPALFKTGTSNGYRDAWTAGIFGPYVLVVWVGNFDNTSHPLLIGATAAKPLFLELARGLAQRERLVDRLSKPSRGLNVQEIEVCTDTGDLDTSLCQHRTATWFIPGVSPIRATGIYRTIRVSAETGLRACEETKGPVKDMPWQFWPSDLELAFRRAGIAKPAPPPFGPECLKEIKEQDLLRQEGPPPQIVLPKYGITYHVSTVPGKTRTVPLKAHAAHGVKTVYWFAGSAFIGASAPEEVLLYPARPGKIALRCVDDAGRSTQHQLSVELEE